MKLRNWVLMFLVVFIVCGGLFVFFVKVVKVINYVEEIVVLQSGMILEEIMKFVNQIVK